MKKSEILKRAKKLLKESSYDHTGRYYICHAIDKAVGSQQAYALKRWITHDLLGEDNSFVTLEDWLDEYHPEFPVDDMDKVQELRHKWIDWMIEYWENKEKR